MAQFSHSPVFWSDVLIGTHTCPGACCKWTVSPHLFPQDKFHGRVAAWLTPIPTGPAQDPPSRFLVVGGCPALWKSTTNALCHSPSLPCPAVLLL